MAQETVWDREYRDPKLIVKENKPRNSVSNFAKFLKKNIARESSGKDRFTGLKFLDLGSGIGKNSYYFAKFGASVIGFEISGVAIKMAESLKQNTGFDIKYVKKNIGEKFPLEDQSIDVVLDVISSNSFNEKEREVYLEETHRVLKIGGYFFVEALSKDGDKNAKHLLKTNPGREKDTYIMPNLGLTERVWSAEDFKKTYGKYFKIVRLEKSIGYPKIEGRIYKRHLWICYMKK